MRPFLKACLMLLLTGFTCSFDSCTLTGGGSVGDGEAEACDVGQFYAQSFSVPFVQSYSVPFVSNYAVQQFAVQPFYSQNFAVQSFGYSAPVVQSFAVRQRVLVERVRVRDRAPLLQLNIGRGRLFGR